MRANPNACSNYRSEAAANDYASEKSNYSVLQLFAQFMIVAFNIYRYACIFPPLRHGAPTSARANERSDADNDLF